VFDGKQFRLAAFASEPACDGYSSGGEWPVLWVTQ
jgi:hypothetical protein